MREILFRGKRIDNGKWINGCFVRYSDYEDDKHYLIYANNGNPNNIYPNTLGQFTGLTDKNGKKIFEGDIIKTYHGTVKVVYSQTYALFGYIMLEKENHEKEYDYRFTDMAIEDGIEVIGNIYDNPDLLGD